MDQAYFCPVCGYITYESVLTGSAIEKKCLSCGSALQGTGMRHIVFGNGKCQGYIIQK